LLFPYLEKYGITAPPKVMWGVDDEIRTEIKRGRKLLDEYKGNKKEVLDKIEETSNRINEMIFKEKSILFPMALDTLTEGEWLDIENESDEIGYCLVEPQARWNPKRVNLESDYKKSGEINGGDVKFNTGILSSEEINSIFNKLPIDITFIDKNDVVKYFSQSEERIFPRTRAVIGRTVQNCHPPASVHIVNSMLEDFRSGKKNSEDFWINMNDMVVYIRYFAIRGKDGEYAGTLEVTQNVKPIQELKGEKRLLT
jgi:DUF438 domain-containing protein